MRKPSWFEVPTWLRAREQDLFTRRARQEVLVIWLLVAAAMIAVLVSFEVLEFRMWKSN